MGVDESQGSNDAVALASGLAGITGSTLMLVNVFPFREPPSPAVNPDFEGYLRQHSQELLERLRSTHGDGTVEVRAIPNPSPAHGLYELAEKEDALIVVGPKPKPKPTSPSATQHTSSPRPPSSSTSCSSARAATAHCTPSWSAASPGAWCARRPAP